MVPAATGVLTGANDVDGDALTAAVVSAPASGTLSLAANGSFVYTPAANVNGLVTFAFRASDGSLNSNNGTITINITAGESRRCDGRASGRRSTGSDC